MVSSSPVIYRPLIAIRAASTSSRIFAPGTRLQFVPEVLRSQRRLSDGWYRLASLVRKCMD